MTALVDWICLPFFSSFLPITHSARGATEPPPAAVDGEKWVIELFLCLYLSSNEFNSYLSAMLLAQVVT